MHSSPASGLVIPSGDGHPESRVIRTSQVTECLRDWSAIQGLVRLSGRVVRGSGQLINNTDWQQGHLPQVMTHRQD
ncbi:unnamed protein product [Protopolystoma xenopodis]|uniref:Uncharacterized protein n=1 Tax=Protopolystoma xenopodis TaxID=117903 RepID=A0A448XST8_9PLAT|nr:unnamed protein product [Protopolystoma xenopodis]